MSKRQLYRLAGWGAVCLDLRHLSHSVWPEFFSTPIVTYTYRLNKEIIMASRKWRADCYLGTSSGTQELEVRSATSYGAEEQFRRVYGAISVSNIREVRDGSNRSSSSSSSDSSGAVGLVALVAAGWAFVSFTPWVVMFIGGGVATWIAQLMVGSTLEETVDDDEHRKMAFILIVALTAGGFGFFKGVEIQQYLNKPDTQIQKTIKK